MTGPHQAERTNQGAAEPSLVPIPAARAPEAQLQKGPGARTPREVAAAESQAAEAKDRPCLLVACRSSCKRTEPTQPR